MFAGIPEWVSEARGHSIAFRVEVLADLDRVAWLPLIVIVIHRRFEKEGVLAL